MASEDRIMSKRSAGKGGCPAEPPAVAVKSLWKEVAEHLDDGSENSQIQWNDIVEALGHAATHLSTSPEARRFVNNHVGRILDEVLEAPGAGKNMPKSRVDKILRTALEIVNKGLVAKDIDGGADYLPLLILAIVFDKGKPYYRDPDEGAVSDGGGRPEARIQQIQAFHHMKGFNSLAAYLSVHSAVDQYFSTLHPLLRAVFDAVFLTDDKGADAAHQISKSVMKHTLALDDEHLRKLPTSQLQQVCLDLRLINKRLVCLDRQTLTDFHEFWRGLVLKLLRSESIEHMFLGLKEIGAMIESTHLPKAVVVSGAGCSFVNGRYELSPSLIERGCIAGDAIVSYECVVPSYGPNVAVKGKRLKLHPCVMEEEIFSSYSSTWWYLSEASESGTDYYFHKSKPHEHVRPPASGWDSTGDGDEPAPTLKAGEELIPVGEERNTLEQQLSAWMVKHKVFDIVLGMHSRIMDAPTAMVGFLMRMSNANDSPGTVDRSTLNQVLGQRMQLLESILPVMTEGASNMPQQSSPLLSQASLVSPSLSSMATSSSSSSDFFTAVAAAKQRLATAERWKQSMERALNEFLAASKEVQDARSYLTELERSREVINVDEEDSDDSGEEVAGRSKRQRRLYKTP